MTFVIGTPFSRGAGYSINNRDIAAARQEDDVQCCTHCQAVIRMRQWKKVENGGMAGGFCMRCNAPVCGPCNTKMVTEGCMPFIEKLERSLDMTVKLRAYIKAAGLEEPAAPRAIFTGSR